MPIKTGGRQKGTPNKKTEDLQEQLRLLNCDPVEGLATIAMNPVTPDELKVTIFKTLLEYVHPKRKALEVSGPNNSRLLTIEDYDELLRGVETEDEDKKENNK